MGSQDIADFYGIMLILGAIVFVLLLATSVSKGKAVSDDLLNRDNDQPERKAKGRILEKTEEVRRHSAGLEYEYRIEWIIFQKDDGTRIRLRNLSKNGILIAVGDEGTVTYRGETICGFEYE